MEKADWVAELEKQNPLKAAEMSLEDDYGMIDGIINNGPKEDKASEKGRENLYHGSAEIRQNRPAEG